MPLFDTDADDLADLTQRVGDADPGVRRVAMLTLAEMPETEASGLLIHGLADPVPEVRVAAAHALESHPGNTVAAALIAALDDPDPRGARPPPPCSSSVTKPTRRRC